MKFARWFVVLTLAATLGCGSKSSERARAAGDAAPLRVRATTVSETAWPQTYEVTGTVRARTAAVIAAKVMGYVSEVNVRVGDRVRRDQVLVRLDARDLDASWRQAQAAFEEASSAVPEADNAVAAAKAGLELAQVTFRRMQDLFQKRSISNQEYDEAVARLRMAEAQFEMAQARRKQVAAKIQQAEQAVKAASVMRSYAEIRAPFDGLVTEKNVEPGNLAAPGAPLLTIEQEARYRLEVAVEESRVEMVRAGQPVRVQVDALGRELNGRVEEIVPAVDAAARSFTVKIDLPPAAGLRSGLFGRAHFDSGQRRALAVPGTAVIERGQLAWVFAVEHGQARTRLVTVGARRNGRVEILSG
ncbi:MAG: efflux RND transporter periplasmic adaptor subunit, partial [Bryobacteraceae bacterium]